MKIRRRVDAYSELTELENLALHLDRLGDVVIRLRDHASEAWRVLHSGGPNEAKLHLATIAEYYLGAIHRDSETVAAAMPAIGKALHGLSRMMSQERPRDIMRRRRAGESLDAIARIWGVSRSTVSRIVRNQSGKVSRRRKR